MNFYDTRDETEKDIWDVRKITGARLTENKCHYLLDFTKIPMPFRNLSKRYLKFRITIVSHSQGRHDLLSLRLFFRFLHERYSMWHDLTNLDRKDMEAYLSWSRSYTEGWKERTYRFLISLRLS